MGTYENSVYSFDGVQFAITGPNLNQYMTGTAEEAYSVEWDGDNDTLTVGAGGDGMHSIRAAQNGIITVRLLKASVMNQALSNAYAYQRTSAIYGGQNVIRLADVYRGDVINGLGCGIRRHPNLSFAVEGGLNEWSFVCTRITAQLGAGVSSSISG